MRVSRYLVLLAVAGAWGAVHAQVQRSGGGGNANAALMQQYQQAVGERTQLQADNAKMKKELDDVQKQLATVQQQAAAAKVGADRGQAAVTEARTSREVLQTKLDETNGKMQELVTRYRDTVTTMRGIETDRNQLKQQLAQSHSEFDQCAKNNDALYHVNTEVLDLYEHQGMLSYVQRAEPFTRLKRTQIENLSDRYRQRAEELRTPQPPAATPPPAAAPTSSAAAPPSEVAPATR